MPSVDRMLLAKCLRSVKRRVNRTVLHVCHKNAVAMQKTRPASNIRTACMLRIQLEVLELAEVSRISVGAI